jgi:hypothetical protein
MILDYRQTPRAKEGYFTCLGKQHTYLFEWENFDTAPRNPNGDAPKFKSWAEFLDAIAGDALFSNWDITSTFMTYKGALILDHYRDSFKWGAVRSIHSPETVPLLIELLNRGLVISDTPVYWGNWARVDGVLAGTVEQLLIGDKITVYHGTSSQRWEKVQKAGVMSPVTPGQRVWPRDRKFKSTAVFFTTCPHRAEYFANHTAQHDRKRVSSKKQKEEIRPVILSMALAPSDVLVNDHDFLEYTPVEEKEPDNSLKLFGQVGVQGSIPTKRMALYQQREVSLV